MQEVSGINVDMYRGGQKAQALAAGESASNPTALSDFSQRLTKLETVGGTLSSTLDKPVRTRYVLIHITELPTDGSPSDFRGGISEIEITS